METKIFYTHKTSAQNQFLIVISEIISDRKSDTIHSSRPITDKKMVGKIVTMFLEVRTTNANKRRVIHKHQCVGGGICEVAGGGRFAVHVVRCAQHPRAYELVVWQGVGVNHGRGGRFGLWLWPLAGGEQGESS